MSDATETWRAIPGYVGIYEVSDQGCIRSLERLDRRGRRVKAKFLKLVWNETYYVVALSRDGEQQVCRVHKLVTEAFYGPRPDGMEVCHNNGDARDNRLANLRYGTPLDNGRDRTIHQTHCKHGHEFTPENVYLHTDRKGYTRRICRICRDARKQAFDQRRRARKYALAS